MAPTASASGGCLYCVNAPVGAGIAVTTGSTNSLCGANTVSVSPFTLQSPTSLAGAFTDSLACSAVGDYNYATSEGFHGITWTSTKTGTVNVYSFWNVSWAANVSASSFCIGVTASDSEARVQLNLSAWDSTSGTATGPVVVTVVDLTTSCGLGSQSSVSSHAYVVHLTLSAVTNHVYTFDTRLLSYTDGDVNGGTGVHMDGRCDVGSSGKGATLSSFEIY